MLVFVGVSLLGLALLLSLPTEESPEPGPTSAAATEPTASPSPSEDPTEPAVNPGLPARQWPQLPPPDSTDPAWVTLQQSVLYDAEIPSFTGCPEATTASTLSELEAQARPQMECLQDVWRPVLAELGLADHEIPIYFYRGSAVDTPCGTVTAPALYCSAQGGAIYFGEDVLAGASFHDYGIKDVTGHEYGHHLQAQAGMFQAEYQVDTGNEGARRLELQATCWGYAMLAHDDSVVIDRDVFSTFEPYLRLTVEDGIHGSHDSLAYWGIRGLYSTDLGNCNTWTADAEDVD